ncbi:MAG: sulfatase-like hydrolase/transferase [Planctomycetota bacterium]|jgi:arylsulfatase|nr:sulfatase-like hydrolase/transferase [Planctomycetota bacterium]
MTRPNIILITTDQQRGDCLSVNGHPEVRTPFLDSLAVRGVNFRRAYTTCPVCIPARRSIISGLHVGSHGLNRNHEAAPFSAPATMPGLLREAGYQTQLIGKLHVAEPGVRHGYDNIIQSETPNDRRRTSHQRRNDYADWFERQSDAPHTLAQGIMSNDRTARPWPLPEHLHHTNWVTNAAADFLERYRDPSAPFFLHLSYWAPHQPALPPQPYWDRYIGTSFTPAMGSWVPEREWQPGLPLPAQRGPFQLREMREHAAGYYGLINHVDDQLNYLFDRWSCSPLSSADRPTWIIFSSDHGEQLGDHHLFRKTAPYEGSTHVPMFIAPLRGTVDAPGDSQHLACLEDILPTCCELAGVELPDHLGAEDGRSLVPVLNGGSNGRSHIHGEGRWQGQHWRYLVEGDRKYIRWTATGEEQVFDLASDAHECADVSGNCDLAPMRSRVDAWRAQAVTNGCDGDAALAPCAGAAPQAVWG